MTAPIWLIAEREFRTYVVTISFWVALVVVPLAVGGGLLLSGGIRPSGAPIPISVVSSDENLARSARAALDEAGRLEGRHFIYDGTGKRLTLSPSGAARLNLIFAPEFPLSPLGRAFIARTLERDAGRGTVGSPALTVGEDRHTDAVRKPDAAAIARFATMMMLWLTLTGSLGMLLQTVVRERATRSLESLLAAAPPWQIVGGKLIGVGAVSLLILCTWLGGSAAFAAFAPKTGLTFAIIANLATPLPLLRALSIYLVAYLFYGSITVALSAMARDSSSAQNMSRPMFVLLLLAFFAALASMAPGAAPVLSWLLYVPVFTPFLLLLHPPGAASVTTQIVLFGILLAASWMAAWFSISRFCLDEKSHPFWAQKEIKR